MKKSGSKSKKTKEASNGLEDVPAEEIQSDSEAENGAGDAADKTAKESSKAGKSKKSSNGTKSSKKPEDESDHDNEAKDDSDDELEDKKAGKSVKKSGRKSKANAKESKKGKEKAKKPAAREESDSENEKGEEESDHDNEAKDESDSETDAKKSKKTPKKSGKKRKAPAKESKKGNEKRKKPPVDEVSESEQEYEVDKVMDERKKNGKQEYLIRWKGFGASDDTWEREDQLNCGEAIKVFHNADAAEEEDEKEKKKPADKKKAVEKKGKGKKPADKKVKVVLEDATSDASDTQYDVEKILEVHFKRNGKREFLIRWKGFGKSDDTWEPEAHLSCTELINAYMAKVEQAKSTVERELRITPKHTDRFTLMTNEPGRRVSRRGGGKQRATYHDFE